MPSKLLHTRCKAHSLDPRSESKKIPQFVQDVSSEALMVYLKYESQAEILTFDACSIYSLVSHQTRQTHQMIALLNAVPPFTWFSDDLRRTAPPQKC